MKFQTTTKIHDKMIIIHLFCYNHIKIFQVFFVSMEKITEPFLLLFKQCLDKNLLKKSKTKNGLQ